MPHLRASSCRARPDLVILLRTYTRYCPMREEQGELTHIGRHTRVVFQIRDNKGYVQSAEEWTTEKPGGAGAKRSSVPVMERRMGFRIPEYKPKTMGPSSVARVEVELVWRKGTTWCVHCPNRNVTICRQCQQRFCHIKNDPRRCCPTCGREHGPSSGITSKVSLTPKTASRPKIEGGEDKPAQIERGRKEENIDDPN